MGRAATAALEVLENSHIDYKTHTFDGGSDHFGEHAAAALGLELSDRIFKTLLIDLNAGKGPRPQLAVCCLPVSFQLNLKKAAKGFQAAKATMANPHDAQKSTGYIPGGISPLGQKHLLPTLIDETAQLWDTIFVSGGKRGLDIELASDDLASLLNAQYWDLLAT